MFDNLAAVQAARAIAQRRYSGRPGIIGFGMGSGAVQVYVRDMSTAREVDAEINGIPVVCRLLTRPS